MTDYIIIGAGTAGCVLARRLLEDDDVSVTVLEAGGAPNHPEIRIPARWFDLMGTDVDWHFFSEPQAHADQRQVVWNRGKALGGSSSINALLYIRGHRLDFDQWAEMGNAGWSYQDVLPYFKKFERHPQGESDYHGGDGLLYISDHDTIHPISEVFVQAGLDLGLPFNADFNGETQYGVGWYQATQKNGERHSAFDAFLEPVLSNPNLAVHTFAHVTRILFDETRAIGVEFIHDNRIKQVFAEREVILCGGAIHSPQLLMCSGIGASAQLEALDIPVIVNLPGVGENLQDHPKVDLHFTSQPSTKQDFSLQGEAYEIYLKSREGILSVIRSQVGAFIKTRPDLDIPDVQLYGAVASVDDPFDFAIVGSLLRPRAIGRVTLRSNNPLASPMIQPNFLADEDDMQRFVDSIHIIRELIQTPAFADFADEEVNPGQDTKSDAAIKAWIRQSVESTWHCSSTCKMGMDSLAVVNPELQVYGTEGLRVVDASIMPTTIGGNTNATVLMIAEKAADIIRGL